MTKSEYVVGVVLVGCAALTWACGSMYRQLLEAYEQSGSLTDSEYSWIFRLLLNLVGYSTILLPGFVLYKYLKKSNYFDKITNTGPVYKLLYAVFGDHERLGEARGVRGARGERGEWAESPRREGLELAFCFTGLMGAYLVWGLLQEKIMTQSYVMSDGSEVRFSDSQFLVFINRVSACGIAAARLLAARRPLTAAPLYRFSYCSLSNIVSAWCQYEALKYVSFPTQVLSKSCKVIPVMLMGKLISRNKYAPYEYGTAVLISVGMALFMLGAGGSAGEAGGSGGSGVAGLGLLALYLACDSFTGTWQAALFAAHPLRAPHMMFGVNLCSSLLTAAALIHRADSPRNRLSMALLQHPVFVADCAVLSASSALGQLLIYRTIARFGAIVFTIIMTLRQAVAILVSCAVYGHAVSGTGALGVLLVFAAVLLRLHCRRRHPPPSALASTLASAPASTPAGALAGTLVGTLADKPVAKPA